jgi:hypothetical protein
MSEVDRVFPRQQEPGTKTTPGETRVIHSASRKRGLGSTNSRVVEVVHVRLGRSKHAVDRSRAAQDNVRAETWTAGFRVKAASTLPHHVIQPEESSGMQPCAHVMPAWEPSPEQLAMSAKAPAEISTIERRKPRTSSPRTPKVAVRLFADPYTADDSGANCSRCGYLVEPTREKRGLMTCSTCG